MGKRQRRKTYTKEFKLDVVRQSFQRENIRELANELGLSPRLIYKWRSVYDKQEPDSREIFTGKGVQSLSPEQQELKRVKAELAEARMERDILKKAIGIFGKRNG
jgi:transposase